MSFDDSFDPDFTQQDPDQLFWQGGSGTMVEHSELVCTSGHLQDQIVSIQSDFDNASGIWVKDAENLGGAVEVFIQKDPTSNLEFRTLIGGSGIIVSTSGNTIRFDSTGGGGGGTVTGATNIGTGSGLFFQDNAGTLEFKSLIEGSGIRIHDLGNELEIKVDFDDLSTDPTVINNVTNVASGVIQDLFLSQLPLNADDDDVTHETVNNLPVSRYRDSRTRFSQWNLRTTQGAASGITLELTSFPQATEAATTVRWVITGYQLPSGVDTSAITTTIETFDLTRDWVANRLYVDELFVPMTIPGLQNFSVKLERHGDNAADTYTSRIYAVSYAIRYEGT